MVVASRHSTARLTAKTESTRATSGRAWVSDWKPIQPTLQVMTSHDGLPAIWLYSPMRDRLVRTADGWKIAKRYIGGSTTNAALTPVDTSAAAFERLMPVLPV